MTIEIWDIDLEGSLKHVDRVLGERKLSSDEIARTGKILNTTQQAEYACGTAAVRQILQDQYGFDGGDRPLERSSNGKTVDRVGDGYFSYTRTSKRLFLAANTDGNIGIDAEYAPDRRMNPDIIQTIQPILARFGVEIENTFPRNYKYIAAWTVLEALIKYEDSTIRWFVSTDGDRWLSNLLNNSQEFVKNFYYISEAYVVSCVCDASVANTSPPSTMNSFNLEELV